jgi:hypothetical protein
MDLSEFRRPKEKPCIIARAVDKLTPEDRAKVLAAFAEADIPSASIAEWFAKRDQNLKGDSIRRHRRGICACGRP